jgi:lysozyme family protein
MADYANALSYLLDNEDAERQYATVPDAGGWAISGINSRAFPEDFQRINALLPDQRATQVAQFYLLTFWVPMKLGGLNAQDVANRVLDMAVNAGMGSGARLLQQAVNRLRPDSVTVDGLIGSQTLTEANACDAAALLDQYRALRIQHYRDIAASIPADQKYLNVWLQRASK